MESEITFCDYFFPWDVASLPARVSAGLLKRKMDRHYNFKLSSIVRLSLVLLKFQLRFRKRPVGVAVTLLHRCTALVPAGGLEAVTTPHCFGDSAPYVLRDGFGLVLHYCYCQRKASKLGPWFISS